MKIHPAVHHRVDDRKANRTTQIAGEVEQAGSTTELHRRKCAKRDIGDCHHAQHQGNAAQDLWDEQFRIAPVRGDCRRHPCADAKPDEAKANHHARVNLG
jgi:hypothetical protein